MSDFVQFEKKLLTHHLESTDFLGVFLFGQKDLPVATLSNLGEDLKVALAQPSSTFS